MKTQVFKKMATVAVIASMTFGSFISAQAQNRRDNSTTYTGSSEKVIQSQNNKKAVTSKKENASYKNKQRKQDKDAYKKHSNAPQVIVYAPQPVQPRIVYRTMPRKALWVHLDGEGYYFYKNRFFRETPRGFCVVQPPKHINHLPSGTVQIWVNGSPVYKYHDIVFIPSHLGFKIHI